MSLEFISRLWSNAREVLRRLRFSIGCLDVLDRKESRDLRRWLTGIEGYVRRIVLLEALNILERGSSDPHRSVRTGAGSARLKTRGPRKPRLRLWPRAKHTGPRARQLGTPLLVRDIWREQRRAALVARLKASRGRRRKAHVILADRMDAIEFIIEAPMRAARRLARKIKQSPRLALKLAFAASRPVREGDETLVREAQNAAVPPALALVLNSS